MPIYEYSCENCGHEFEYLVRGDEKPCCPACAASRLTKKFSVPAAHTAGSSGPNCPASEGGACDFSACGGGACGLTDLT